MMRTLATLAALAVGVPAGASRTAAESASRIVDRTVVCEMTGTGFPDQIRFMSVGASSRSQANLPPFVSARNGASGEAGVSAGLQTGPGPTHRTGYVLLSAT